MTINIVIFLLIWSYLWGAVPLTAIMFSRGGGLTIGDWIIVVLWPVMLPIALAIVFFREA